MKLEGKVIAIAGGAGGIGAEVSRRYASDGATVLVGDVNADAAAAVAESIREVGGKATSEQIDIGDDESVERFVARCEELNGGLDAFHANAAYFAPQDYDAVEIPLDVYRTVMTIDAEGFLLCTRHAVPPMLKRGGGSLLYTSSGAAHQPFPVRVGYSMAKAAVHALMRHVALRWGKEGIRANVIAPGVILHQELEKNAPMLRDQALQRCLTPYVGAPNDIAAMASLLASDEGRFITGQVISVDGGATLRP